MDESPRQRPYPISALPGRFRRARTSDESGLWLASFKIDFSDRWLARRAWLYQQYEKRLPQPGNYNAQPWNQLTQAYRRRGEHSNAIGVLAQQHAIETDLVAYRLTRWMQLGSILGLTVLVSLLISLQAEAAALSVALTGWLVWEAANQVGAFHLKRERAWLLIRCLLLGLVAVSALTFAAQVNVDTAAPVWWFGIEPRHVIFVMIAVSAVLGAVIGRGPRNLLQVSLILGIGFLIALLISLQNERAAPLVAFTFWLGAELDNLINRDCPKRDRALPLSRGVFSVLAAISVLTLSAAIEIDMTSAAWPDTELRLLVASLVLFFGAGASFVIAMLLKVDAFIGALIGLGLVLLLVIGLSGLFDGAFGDASEQVAPLREWLGSLSELDWLMLTLGVASVLMFAGRPALQLVDFLYWLCFRYALSPARAMLTVAASLFVGAVGAQEALQHDMLVIDTDYAATRALPIESDQLNDARSGTYEFGFPGPAPFTRNADEAAQNVAGEGAEIYVNVSCEGIISPTLYAADVFIPLVNLRQEFRCHVASAAPAASPESQGRLDSRGFWLWAKNIYRLLGWIIVSLTVVTFITALRRSIGERVELS